MTNEDLISRQAAIDAINKPYDISFCELPLGNRSFSDIAKCIMMAYYKGKEDAIKHIQDLPSAQQEETCDTCKYGFFGDGMCDYCRVGFPSNYERRTEQPVDKDTNVPCNDTQPKNENEPIKQAQIAPNEDLISRKTAIDAIQGIGRLATLPDNDAVIRMSAVEYVLFNSPSAQPEQRWIPVTERLPDKDDFYLVSSKSKAYPDDLGEIYTQIFFYDCCEWACTNRTVTAWMPLPEPYREEGD